MTIKTGVFGGGGEVGEEVFLTSLDKESGAPRGGGVTGGAQAAQGWGGHKTACAGWCCGAGGVDGQVGGAGRFLILTPESHAMLCAS